MIVLVAARSLRLESDRTVVLAFFDVPIPELCTFRRTVGLDCPGCGLTRSFVLAAKLEFLAAWNMNAAGCLLFVSLMLSVPFRFIQWFRTQQGVNVGSTLGIEAGWLISLASIMFVGWTLRIFF